MKILLMTTPYSVEERYGKALKNVGPSLLPPLGLAYIAAAIEKEGHDVRILDTAILNMSIKDIKDYFRNNKFDIIGITLMTPMYLNFVNIVKAIKPLTGKTPLVAGGAHPSILPVETLKENPGVDYSVFGEGESVFPDLINAIKGKKSVSAVNGVAYREGKAVKITKPAKMIENLDELPMPARHLLDNEKYIPAPSTYRKLPVMHISSSRGCPYNCTYCSSQSVFGRKYRSHSVDRVLEELKLLMNKYGAKEVCFLDDIFTLNKRWMNDLCNRLIREGINKKISWSCSTRVNLVDLSLLKKMKKAGCWQIHFGIESGSQRLLNLIKKGITLQQSRDAIKCCRKVGIKTRAYFMLGLPTETKEESLKTIAFAKEIDPDYVKFSLTTPYPGTELFDIVKKEGNLKSESWSIYKTMGGFGSGTERPYVPKGRTSKELNELQKRAHKEFFFRPKIILRFLLNIRSIGEIRLYAKTALALFNL